MITFAASLLTGMALGLYAGKKRGNGDGWCKISKDLFDDAVDTAKSVWRKASGPFRKGSGPESDSRNGSGGQGVDKE